MADRYSGLGLTAHVTLHAFQRISSVLAACSVLRGVWSLESFRRESSAGVAWGWRPGDGRRQTRASAIGSGGESTRLASRPISNLSSRCTVHFRPLFTPRATPRARSSAFQFHGGGCALPRATWPMLTSAACGEKRRLTTYTDTLSEKSDHATFFNADLAATLSASPRGGDLSCVYLLQWRCASSPIA